MLQCRTCSQHCDAGKRRATRLHPYHMDRNWRSSCLYDFLRALEARKLAKSHTNRQVSWVCEFYWAELSWQTRRLDAVRATEFVSRCESDPVRVE